MRTIRLNVFETNSSSTHSLAMCMKDDYDRWTQGLVYFVKYEDSFSKSEYKTKKFVTREEAIDILTNSKYPPDKNIYELDEDDFEELLYEHDIWSYNMFLSSELATFNDEYTTPSGENVVAFGNYGYE